MNHARYLRAQSSASSTVLFMMPASCALFSAASKDSSSALLMASDRARASAHGIGCRAAPSRSFQGPALGCGSVVGTTPRSYRHPRQLGLSE